MQVLGGYGYFNEYVVERLWRDAKLLEIGGGTLEAHQKNITKDLTRAYGLYSIGRASCVNLWDRIMIAPHGGGDRLFA